MNNNLIRSQLGTIFTLFVLMRLTITCLFTTEGLFTNYTDYAHYYSTAQLSEEGYYPFVNMWYEYFPVLTYIPQAAYKIVRLSLPPGDLYSFSYLLFTRILQIFLLPFDTGILLLTYSIATKIWGINQANLTGWIYLGLSLPFFYWTFGHQLVLVFFVLLSIYFLLNKRLVPSSISLGLAIATKLSPVFMLAPVMKFLWPQKKQILLYVTIAIGTIGLIFLPFIMAGGGKWILASFASIFKLSSYRTIWAIIDGNWDPGYVGELDSRLDLAQAYQDWGNPPTIHPIILIIPFSFIYGWIFFKKVKETPQNFIWFTTLTGTIFHLWLKGWSPQWSTFFIPLLLLSFPTTQGVVMIVILSITVFLEWPIGSVFNSHALIALSILIRTILFIMIALLMAEKLGIIKGFTNFFIKIRKDFARLRN